jgi:hypothetical protein
MMSVFASYSSCASHRLGIGSKALSQSASHHLRPALAAPAFGTQPEQSAVGVKSPHGGKQQGG